MSSPCHIYNPTLTLPIYIFINDGYLMEQKYAYILVIQAACMIVWYLIALINIDTAGLNMYLYNKMKLYNIRNGNIISSNLNPHMHVSEDRTMFGPVQLQTEVSYTKKNPQPHAC